MPWTARRERNQPSFVGHVEKERTVGEAVLALDFVNTELDLSERVLVVLVEVREGEFEDSALESISGVLCIPKLYQRLRTPPVDGDATDSFRRIG